MDHECDSTAANEKERSQYRCLSCLYILGGTTISATNHIGHDHFGQKNIGHRQYRPQSMTISATLATRNLHVMPTHVYMTSACTLLVYIENFVRDKAAMSAGQDHSHATPAVEGVGRVRGWQSVCRRCPTCVRSHLSVHVDRQA